MGMGVHKNKLVNKGFYRVKWLRTRGITDYQRKILTAPAVISGSVQWLVQDLIGFSWETDLVIKGSLEISHSI